MTIDQILENKYKTSDKRKEVLTSIQKELGLSRPHFFRKRKGISPLSLEQAVIVSRILKVPVSKLMILFVCVCLCAGCGETQPATYPVPGAVQNIQETDQICLWMECNYMSF